MSRLFNDIDDCLTLTLSVGSLKGGGKNKVLWNIQNVSGAMTHVLTSYSGLILCKIKTSEFLKHFSNSFQ